MESGVEGQEKFEFYQAELKKKDELIRKLSMIKLNNNENCSTLTPKLSANSAEQLEKLRKNMFQLQKMVDGNKSELRESQIRIQELNVENERIGIEQLNTLNQKCDLEELIQRKDEKLKEYSTLQNRNELALSSLQEDLKTKQDKICELIEKTNQLKTREKQTSSSFTNEIQQHNNGLQKLALLLECSATYKNCIEKLKDLLRKNIEFESQTTRMADSAETFEFEQRAARETTLRLSGELNKETNAKESAIQEANNLRKELAIKQSLLEENETRTRLLADRVKALTESLETAHKETEKREVMLRRIRESEDKEKDNNQHLKHHSDSQNHGSHDGKQFTTNSKSVSKIRQENAKKDFCEESIIGRDFLAFVRKFLNVSKEASVGKLLKSLKENIITTEEELLKTKQAAANVEALHNDMLSSNRVRETKLIQLVDKVQRIQRELNEAGIIIDRTTEENRLMHKCLMKVAESLKLNEIAAEYELGLLTDAIVARLRGVLNGEGERTAGQRVKITRLSQSAKELKERNQSLELQVAMLRKRIAESEEAVAGGVSSSNNTVVGRGAPSMSTHKVQLGVPLSSTASIASAEKEKRRLTKQLENIKSENSTLQSENMRLKSELLGINQKSLTAIGTTKMIHVAESKIKELQRQCDQQEVELYRLRQTLSTKVEEMRGNDLSGLNKNMEDLRSTLEETRRSENHLLDFRMTVARLLDLDCDQLAVPDFQIVHRLERILNGIQLETLSTSNSESRNSFFET